MRTYTNDELKTILNSHMEWLRGSGGQRADLSYADLTCADLTGAIMTGSKLTG